MRTGSRRLHCDLRLGRDLESEQERPHTLSMAEIKSLTNHLLVAMPGLEDPGFSQSVMLVCEHGEKGALGIMLNRPLPMKLSEVLTQMNLAGKDDRVINMPVLRGGPVHPDRGFVLHRPGGQWESSHRISSSIQVTTSRDVLQAMAEGAGPEDAFIALGYAGWEPGQLESEIKQNSWLTVPVDEEVLFRLPYEQRWAAAWRLIGADVTTVVSGAGRA